MNTTTYPIKPIKTQKLTLTNEAYELSTKSQPCLLSVVSGKVFLGGKRDITANGDSYILNEGDTLRLFGDIKLCSDENGADVRILFYDVV